MDKATIMISWDAHKIWCNTCQRWIGEDDLMLSGKHVFYDGTGKPEESAHTVWEK